MSYRAFFSLSQNLEGPISVPKGTLEQVMERVALTEKELGFEIGQYATNPKYWKVHKPKEGISDKVFCEVAEEHNHFVRWLYYKFEECWEKPTIDGEVITPEEASTFWHGLVIIEVPSHKWTDDYYRARMEALYEVMRGREHEGMTFDSEPLNPEQAASVINLFAQWLDHGELDLDVPKGCDHLASSSDGGYIWCEKCGAVTDDHVSNCSERGCPAKEFIDEE